MASSTSSTTGSLSSVSGSITVGSPSSLSAQPQAETVLRCSKCKITTYSNREAQRADWATHKKLCFSPENTTIAANICRTALEMDERKKTMERLTAQMSTLETQEAQAKANRDETGAAAFHATYIQVQSQWEALSSKNSEAGFAAIGGERIRAIREGNETMQSIIERGLQEFLDEKKGASNEVKAKFAALYLNYKPPY